MNFTFTQEQIMELETYFNGISVPEIYPSPDIFKDFEMTAKYLNYSFYVDALKEIRTKDIYQDLDYSNPFVIIEFEEKTFAMIHHTIFDKYKKSKLAAKFTPNDLIEKGFGEIQKKDIGKIVSEIRLIKQSEWQDQFKKNMHQKTFTVNVKNIKI